MRPRVLLAAVAALSLLAASCRNRAAVDPKGPIILISIDTLRSDHLPAYGYSKVSTPALDALRGDSILFERAYTQCPLTLVSHASVFTGKLPAEHGIRDNLGYNLNPKTPTLAELLKSKGYATGGAVSALVLRGETGVKRGFDFWDDAIDLDPNSITIARAQRSGDVTRELAQKWISGQKGEGKPFFFFLHIYEPHTPYEPPEPFKSKYGNAYDGEVAAADDIAGKFLQYLRDEGIYDKATIVLMSDHGEGLGDHGESEHGILLYRETLQVPLMLKLPHSARKNTSVSTPVQLIDIYATIAEAFGVTKTDGRSLVQIAEGKAGGPRDIYSETYYPRLHFGWSDMHSIIEGSNHYIHAPKPELYDIVADPDEKKNVMLENRRAYTAMRERIQPFIHAAAAPADVSDEQKQQLMALGYLGSAVSTSSDAVLPDPKENIAKANLIGEAFRAFKDAKYEDAVKLSGQLLHDNPNMIDIWSLRTHALERLDRKEEAIAAGKQGLRLAPDNVSLAVAVANLSVLIGHLDDAEAHAKLFVKSAPTEAHRISAEVALERKDWARAREEAALAGGEKRDRPLTQLLLGRVALGQGSPEEALKNFDAAMSTLTAEHRKPLPKLLFFRADALARMGRGDEAEQGFLQEIKLYPTDPQPYKNLILLYATEGKTQQATALIFSLEQAMPTLPTYLAICQTLKVIGDVNGSRFWAARGLSHFPADRQLLALYRG